MSAYNLPATASRNKATVNVFLRDAETNLNGEQYVVSLGALSGGTFDAAALAAADDTYQGDVITGIAAGAAIAQWEAVYLASDGTWNLADGNGSGTYPARGLAVAAAASSAAVTVIQKGYVRNDAWNWTVGGNVYLSNTPGSLTQTATSTSGERLQALGYAVTADKIALIVNPTFQTIP